MKDTINVHRHAILNEHGAVINCVMGPLGYECPYGNTAVHDPSETVEIGWATTDGGKTFTPPLATSEQLFAVLRFKQRASLNQLWTFNIGEETAPIIVTTKLDTAGQTAMQHLLLWAQLNESTGAAQSYVNDDYSLVSLNAFQARYLGVRAMGIVSQSFHVLSDAVAKVKAGTITTLEDVDCITWPRPTTA